MLYDISTMKRIVLKRPKVHEADNKWYQKKFKNIYDFAYFSNPSSFYAEIHITHVMTNMSQLQVG